MNHNTVGVGREETYIQPDKATAPHNHYNTSLLNTLDDASLLPVDLKVMPSLGEYNKSIVVPVLYDNSLLTKKFDEELIAYMQDNTKPPSLQEIFALINKIPEANTQIQALRKEFLDIEDKTGNIQINRLLENYRKMYRQKLFHSGWSMPTDRKDAKEGDLDRTSGEYTVMSNIITLLLLQSIEK